VTHIFGLVIESMVAVLLLLTIGYCLLLNRKLRRLNADEQSLKAVIAELITATEIAERAIAGLKLTVRDCDQNLGERLRTAERFSADIGQQIDAGRDIMDRLAQIVLATRPAPAPEPTPPAPDTRAMLAAAHAFDERARSRVNGLAA
jgi:hypothetical protein